MALKIDRPTVNFVADPKVAFRARTNWVLILTICCQVIATRHRVRNEAIRYLQPTVLFTAHLGDHANIACDNDSSADCYQAGKVRLKIALSVVDGEVSVTMI